MDAFKRFGNIGLEQIAAVGGVLVAVISVVLALVFSNGSSGATVETITPTPTTSQSAQPTLSPTTEPTATTPQAEPMKPEATNFDALAEQLAQDIEDFYVENGATPVPALKVDAAKVASQSDFSHFVEHGESTEKYNTSLHGTEKQAYRIHRFSHKFAKEEQDLLWFTKMETIGRYAVGTHGVNKNGYIYVVVSMVAKEHAGL